jgi:formate hydrogenlyase subunit 6/NADH:ubiquinone oxidoreductase subunit I
MEGIDYQYCKGCLKCVEICPGKKNRETGEKDFALTAEREADFDTYELSAPHYDFQKKLGLYAKN